MLQFKMYYVFYNPATTYASRGRRRIAELKRLVGNEHVMVIESLPHGLAANRRLLEARMQRFGSDAVLCVAAGDGTVNLAMETLVSSRKLADATRLTPLLPLWGGNANDLAHMLNGSERTSLGKVFAKAESVAIYPLACRLRYPDGEQETRVAACYASFGATAYAAAHLNRPRHRHNPWWNMPVSKPFGDFLAGANGLIEAPLFDINERGKRKKIYEREFINGSRFAKLNFASVRLTDRAFRVLTIRHKHIAWIANHLWQLFTRYGDDRRVQDDVTFTCEHQAMAQFDGETLQLPAGTTVTVGLADTCFYALSTRLAGGTS